MARTPEKPTVMNQTVPKKARYYEILLVGIGTGNCDGCYPYGYITEIARFGKYYLCADCLRQIATELDRVAGR